MEQVGKYRIDGILGKGATGVVYKAFDLGTGRVVALKTIRKELFGSGGQPELIRRFRHEARVAGRLRHPNIVAIHDYSEDAESAFIAMEYVAGTALDSLLAPKRPIALPRVLALMDGLLGGLAYAHARGVVHRDVKPANLLLTPAGEVKIGDFGIARIACRGPHLAGAMAGTPSYMSPEQLRGEACDGRCDVFSAGVVLYQLLTGARPFAGAARTVMRRILEAEPKPPSEVLDTQDTRFDAVLATALAKQPGARYPTAQAFHEALLAAAHALPGAAADSPEAAGDAAVPPWMAAARPALEASLARQVGPQAALLLDRVAAQAEGLEHLHALLLPHIPSEVGRRRFGEAYADIRKGLDAAGSVAQTPAAVAAHTASVLDAGAPPVKPAALDKTFVDASALRLAALIGPIGRVLARRAMQRTDDRLVFLHLLASHIDNPGARAHFLAHALPIHDGPSP